MANIVIIDDEAKVRREISQYLKEMGVEDIVEFSNSSEFDREYFLGLAKKAGADAPTEPHNPLAHVSPELVKYLTVATFASDNAISEKTAELEINAEQTQILKASVSKLFGRVVTEIVSKNMTFSSFVVDEFKPLLKTHLDTALAGKETTTQLLATKNDKGEIWALEIKASKNEKNILLKLTDLTREIAHQLGKEKAPETAVEETKAPIDLILFRHTCVQGKDIKAWVTKTATLLKKAGLWPEGNRPKFIALRYEDDAKEKAEFNHPFIDDLLCLPFDRLIFLQKIENVLALPKKVSPSFLFVQASQDEIEISKKVMLERISDLGFAMANPIPLAPGTPGHFYFRFPGQKPLLDVYAKVTNSTLHPDRDNEHLVYFNFFGLNKNTNKEVKAYLMRDSGYKNLVEHDPANFRFNPESIFHTEAQKKRKTVALIEHEENVTKSVMDYLKNEVHNIDIAADDTYTSFFKKYLEKKTDAQKASPAQAEDLYADNVSFLVGVADYNLQMCLTPPTEHDRLLGHIATELFAEPQAWMKIFNSDARDLLTECLHLVKNTGRVSKNFALQNFAGELRMVLLEIILEGGGEIFKISIKLPDMKLQMKMGQLARLESLDCVIIDHALLPEDVDAFCNGLKEAVKNAGLQCPVDGPHVIVIADDNNKVRFDKLLKSKVFGLVYKPIEIRRLLYLVANALNTPYSVYTFENIGWKHDKISAKIARNSQLAEMSEFGATLRSEQPLKPGTMLYLFKSIFQNAPDQNLCVRVYASEEDPKNDGQYLNWVTYFGITDTFLKFTRAYIRETYAVRKSQGEKGGAE